MKRPTTRHNIVLIGMPASGKSTLGVLLAKRLGMPFIDTDIMIQAGEGSTLREIIDQRGIDYFKRLEERYVCRLRAEGTVIATGGSVVYSSAAMEYLRSQATVIWLHVSLDVLQGRLGSLQQRGVIIEAGQTLEQLFKERNVLYRRYCHRRIPCDGLSHEQAIEAIVEALRDCPQR